MSMTFRASLVTALAALAALGVPPAAAQPPAPRPAPDPRPRVAPAPETRPEVERALRDARREMERAMSDVRWDAERAMSDARWELEHQLDAARWEPRVDLHGLHDLRWELGHELAWELQPRLADVERELWQVAPQVSEAVERAMAEAAHAWPAEAELAMADAMRAAEWSAAELAPVAEAARWQAEAALADAAREWGAPARGAAFRATAPAPWAAQDPADSLYRLAREALNRGDNRRAATLFAQIGERHPRSAYAVDATYYEAFARYRLRSEPELRQALRVLEARLARNVSSSTSADAAALAARIRGELAGASQVDAARQRAALQQAARAGDGCDREEAAVRIEALNALAKIDSTAVLPSVRRVLANQAACAASLRESAVLILGRSRSPEAEGLLIQAARTDSSRGVRAAAMAWLARNPTDRGLAAIEQILRGADDERTQAAAISALARTDDPRGRQALRALAERADASVKMRSHAILELGRDSSAAAAAWLRGLYGRVDSLRLKESVLAGVARNRSAESAQWLAGVARDAGQPVRLRREALAWYTRRPDVAVADLARLYDATPEWELRETVIGSLMRRKEPEATDKLLAIARSDDDPRLRRAAIGALSRKDDPRTVRLLTEIIDRVP
jgi:HEAT repeat protein